MAIIVPGLPGLVTPEEYERELLKANQAVKLDPMPQRRGKSKQDFGTPEEFLIGLQKQFGKIGIDLAARADNTVADRFISPEQDSLKTDWSKIILPTGDIAFANPPFADLAPWAKQLETTRHLSRWTIMLCPASMGSKWWVTHVLGKIMSFGIPRMKFRFSDGMYPKDLAIICAGFGVSGTGYFDWRKQ